MTVIQLKRWSESDQDAIRQQLDRILHSAPFHQSQRRQRFLEYLVNETLAGRGERLKGYNVALEVFDRPETFDPVVHPLVRVEAARLREKLLEYYAADGKGDPIRICLPKGTYAPLIEFLEGEKQVEEYFEAQLALADSRARLGTDPCAGSGRRVAYPWPLGTGTRTTGRGKGARRTPRSGDRGSPVRQLKRLSPTRVFQ